MLAASISAFFLFVAIVYLTRGEGVSRFFALLAAAGTAYSTLLLFRSLHEFTELNHFVNLGVSFAASLIFTQLFVQFFCEVRPRLALKAVGATAVIDLMFFALAVGLTFVNK